MNLIKTAALFAVTALLSNAWAQEAEMERPSMSTSRTMTVSAVVEAINHETRVVTVKKADGEQITFTASEEARNLDQVAVGDILRAEYIESLSIDDRRNDGLFHGCKPGHLAFLGTSHGSGRDRFGLHAVIGDYVD